jgi:exodeoxyribonuclease VII small subunit
MTGKIGEENTKTTSDANSIEALSFEELLAQLESVVKSLESGNLSLDSAVEFFEKGSKLQACCEKKLAEAKIRIEKVLAKADSISFEEMSN